MKNLSSNSCLAEKLAIRVSVISIIVNIVLSLFKFIAGVVGNSYAMISDSIHSFSDVLSTVVVIIGVKISAKVADKTHRFGHERFECVTAIVLSVMLVVTGFEIARIGLQNITSCAYKSFNKPKGIALVASIISIVSKEALFWYTYVIAKRFSSSALKADAWHHRSDALSSVGSLIGIFGAMQGLLILDSIASIVIGMLIFKVSIDIFVDSVKKMTDEAADNKTETEIINFISKNFDCGIDDFKTRVFANRIYVDLEISLNGKLMLCEAHEFAHNIHDEIEKSFPCVKHIMIHVNPN